MTPSRLPSAVYECAFVLLFQVCQDERGGLVCGKQSTAAFVVDSEQQPTTLTLTYTGGDPDQG